MAAEIWSGVTRSQRQNLGDILIAAVAISRKLPLVTRTLPYRPTTPTFRNRSRNSATCSIGTGP